jgi:hypothetical protein
MKEYRLVAWPQMRAPFDRIAHRRMLSDMSHRYLTLPQLAASTGMRRQDVRAFLDALNARALLIERDAAVRSSMLRSLLPFGGWLRRAFSPASIDR